jgi:magnesium transporter
MAFSMIPAGYLKPLPSIRFASTKSPLGVQECLMLAAYPTHRPDPTVLKSASWVDLIDPTPEEGAAFQKAFGLHVPTSDEIAEIQATSRLRVDHNILYMTAPLIMVRDAHEPWVVAPTGFVLSKTILLTTRTEKLAAFDVVIAELGQHDKLDPALAFVRLLEVSVERMADLMEGAAHDLDEASHLIFRPENPSETKLSRETAKLRRLMIRTGRTSERMSRIQYTLVCLDRIAKFTADRCRDWVAQDLASRLQRVSSDIASLEQYAEGLISRVQLLQDAAGGIINIDQNEVMKVLTIASVVGIPPVLVAGIYGMNFKNMPEYDWSWGYPYALTVIAVTALLPLIWFKWKDWI